MGQLTTDMIAALCGFRQETIDAMTADLGAGENVDAVAASGACSLTRKVTELTVSGTKAYTLAAPTNVNQEKIITCVSAGSTPLGTLTISSPDDTAGFVCPATVLFDAAGQEIRLRATADLKWRVTGVKRAGVKVVVAGTDVLTSVRLAHTYSMSVDGTKDSTGTKALPDGLVPGDMCVVACSSAQNTPIGSIDFAGVTLANAAVTHLQAIGATTDTVTLTWTGTAWLVIANSGITLA